MEGMGGDIRVIVGSRSCTVMLSTLVSLKWIGGDLRVIVGHRVAIL